MPNKNKAAIFDLDGTLLNTGLTFHTIVNELKSELNEALVDFEPVRKFSSRGATLILKNCFKAYSDQEIENLKYKFLSKYEKRLTENLVLYQGIELMLDDLERKGIPWGIVTNKSWKYTGPIIKRLGWDKKTDAIICPDHVSEAKPNPEGVLLAATKLDADLEESFYVGDHRRDIETGKNAGTKTIACSWGYAEDDPTYWGADFIANTAEELREWILKK